MKMTRLDAIRKLLSTACYVDDQRVLRGIRRILDDEDSVLEIESLEKLENEVIQAFEDYRKDMEENCKQYYQEDSPCSESSRNA